MRGPGAPLERLSAAPGARPRAGTPRCAAGAAALGAVARLGGLAAAAADLGVYAFAISATSEPSVLQVLQGDLMVQV